MLVDVRFDLPVDVGTERLGEAFGGGRRLRDETVPKERTGEGLRLRPDPDDPERHAGLLHRRRPKRHRVHLEVLALEGERLSRHEAGQHLQAFVETGGARLEVHRLADFVETAVILGRPYTRSQNDATVGQVVERHDLSGQLPGTPSRNGGEHRTENEALGPHRHRSHEDPGVEERKGGEVCRLDPDRVGRDLEAGTTVAVLHGSNLGTCRALAKQFAEEATDMGCTATVGPLDDAAGGLPAADAIVIVASSYNGQPTDDARAFLRWLLDPDAKLTGAPYFAVLGVGDRNWADSYQAVPQRIDERLTQLGGRPLVPRGAADTSGDLTGTVEEFTAALWAALSRHFGDPDARPVTDSDEPLYDLRQIVGPVTAAIDARFAVAPMTVLDSTELVSAGNSRGLAKHFVRVALPAGVEYHTGDHLTVLADNPPDVVEQVMELLGINPELRLAINPRRSSRRLIALDREVSVRELLTHFVELRKPATRSQLRRLAAANPCAPERQRLNQLAEASEPCDQARRLGEPGDLPERVAGSLRWNREALVQVKGPWSKNLIDYRFAEAAFLQL